MAVRYPHKIMHNGLELFATHNQKQVSVHSSCLHYEIRGPLGELKKRDGKTPAATAAQGDDGVVEAGDDEENEEE
ncbi:hypothetical protein HDU90_000712 [Geranomyces variabilis]|nr:hypothetical protein HDU90_000712 [Geranomyces variabilis]